MFLKKIFVRIIDRFFCVSGALLFSQIPNFIEQYHHRLAGHVDELRYQMAALEKIATTSHSTLNNYIHKFLIQTDPDFHKQGLYLEKLSERYVKLLHHLTELSSAGLFKKPFYLLSHVDFSIGWQTTKNFTTSLPLTFEGLIYIIIGIFFGTSLFWFLRRIVNFKLRKQSTQNDELLNTDSTTNPSQKLHI